MQWMKDLDASRLENARKRMKAATKELKLAARNLREAKKINACEHKNMAMPESSIDYIETKCLDCGGSWYV